MDTPEKRVDIHPLDIHSDVTKKAKDLMVRKAHDYAGKVDPYRNFRQCQSLGLCSVEQGILVRMSDKVSRLATFASGGEFKVKDEALEDTVVDVINYAIILMAYVAEKKRLEFEANRTNDNFIISCDAQSKVYRYGDS
jgi:hypothetical protein